MPVRQLAGTPNLSLVPSYRSRETCYFESGMPEDNGDYLSRFERVEKTIERIVFVQERQQEPLNALTRDVTTLHGTMRSLKENTDRLLVGLRELIDRIPPENLRYRH